MVLKNILNTVTTLFYLFIFLILSYQITSAIVGGTWETENIIIAALGIIITMLFITAGFLINQGRTIGILEERTKNIGNSLTSLGNDFKNHVSKYHKS